MQDAWDCRGKRSRTRLHALSSEQIGTASTHEPVLLESLLARLMKRLAALLWVTGTSREIPRDCPSAQRNSAGSWRAHSFIRLISSKKYVWDGRHTTVVRGGTDVMLFTYGCGVVGRVGSAPQARKQRRWFGWLGGRGSF